MKPSKNRHFCMECERVKMLFESQKKADKFIEFNSADIETINGYKPERSYYCDSCGGWHITSKKDKPSGRSITDVVLDLYQKEKSDKAIRKAESEKIKLEKINNLIACYGSIEVDLASLEISNDQSSDYLKAVKRIVCAFDQIKNISPNFKGGSKRKKDLQAAVELLRPLVASNTEN